ncbi:MAG: hypothetical protein HY866_04020 [Chloroflexi bacterium]|nr:hypothetical protein [Chloroflexota bacterium]
MPFRPSFSFPMTLLAWIVVCALVITGCSSDRDDAPVPTRIPPIDFGNPPPTAIIPDAPPTALPPTWTPKPSLTPAPLTTIERTPRPTETPYIIPTRTRPPDVEAQVRQLSDLPVITAENAARLTQVALLEQQVRDVVFSPDGSRLVLAVNYQGVQVYDLAGLDFRLRRMGTTWNWPLSLSYHPTRPQVAAAYDDGRVRIWNPETGGVVRVIDAFNEAVWSVAFSSNGQMLAGGGDNGRIKLWEADSGALVCELNASADEVYRLDFQPAGGTLLIAGGNEEYVWVWDTASCTQRAILATNSFANTMAFNPDGKSFAGSGDVSDYTIYIWDSLALDEAEPLMKLETGFGFAIGLAYSPDGSLLAAITSDDELLIWDMATYRQVAQISTYVDWADVVRFSPDSRLILLAGEYTDVVFYGVTSGG